jgi:hypothetical protein
VTNQYSPETMGIRARRSFSSVTRVGSAMRKMLSRAKE